jgi:NAD(P)-dependent dehydrogenase (short-subunit alcohol dehydrogenase family)
VAQPIGVVITGASTGIGRAAALRLARAGHQVFAGVRKPADAESLTRENSRIVPVTIDVTDRSSIEAAAAQVKDSMDGRGLGGLVNNAGIAVSAPLETIRPEDLRRQFDVNVFGLIDVTQVFLPSLRAGSGRIVNIGSVSGRAPSVHLIGPYAASKWAVEALSDTLRLELKPWGIHVSVIEPGNIATPIWDKAEDGLEDMPVGSELYARVIERGRSIAKYSGTHGISPEKVAKRIEHALTARAPRNRYLVGIDAYARAHLEARLPHRVRDRVIARVVK